MVCALVVYVLIFFLYTNSYSFWCVHVSVLRCYALFPLNSSDPVEPVPMPLRDAPTPGGGTEAQMGRTIAQDTQGQGQPAAGQGQMRSSLQASLDRTYSTPSQETQHNIVSQPVTTAPRRSAGDGQSNGTYARAPLKANTVTGQNLSSSSGSQSQSSPSLSLRSDGPDSDQVTGHGNGQGESMGESIVLDIKTSGGGWWLVTNIMLASRIVSVTIRVLLATFTAKILLSSFMSVHVALFLTHLSVYLIFQCRIMFRPCRINY